MESDIEYLETEEYNKEQNIKHIKIRIDLENIILYNNFISIYYLINILIKIINISIHIHTNYEIYEYFNNIIIDFKNCNLKKIYINIPNVFIENIEINKYDKEILNNIDIKEVRFMEINLYIKYEKNFESNFRQIKKEYKKILKYFFNIREINFKNINYYNFFDFNNKFYYLFNDDIFEYNINLIEDNTELKLENDYKAEFKYCDDFNDD